MRRKRAVAPPRRGERRGNPECILISLISSVSLLSVQIEHKDNRLCVVAGDNDSLFERENQPKDLWIQSPTGRIGKRKGPDLIFARQQILEEKLSPRINIRG